MPRSLVAALGAIFRAVPLASYTVAMPIHPPSGARDWIALSDDPLPEQAATAWAATPRSGATVSFAGVVRDHAEGREGVTAMTYEAYDGPALERMGQIAAEARRRWPEVERLVLLHRLGEIGLSEASVLVVASAPHRGEAFEAARYCIDTLKETVPIWKKEHWPDGEGWALGATEVRGV